MRCHNSVLAFIAGKFWCWQREEAGKAVIEHALLLALIVGSLAVSLEVIGFRGQETWMRLARAPAPAAENRPRSDGSAESRAELVANKADAIVASASEKNGLILATTVTLLLATLGVHFLSGRKQRMLSPDDGQTVAAAQTVPVRLQARYLAKRQDIFRGLAGDTGRLLHNQLIVAQIMSRPSGQTGPEKPAREIAEMMRERQSHHLLICAPCGELLGVVSDRDLAKGLDKTAGEIMARDPITTTPEALVTSVVSLMLDRRISSLPVVQGGKLVGIVTMSDIAMTLQCSLQLIDQLLQQIEQGEAAPRGAALENSGEPKAGS